MQIMRPENTTRVLAENQDEFENLPIVDVVLPDNVPAMLSCWKPTPEELQTLNEGGFVTLGILGVSHPPVMLYVHPDSKNPA